MLPFALRHLQNIRPLLQRVRNLSNRVDSKYFGIVPRDALTVSFARSGGKGGQNVNKVNTKVDIRFNINEADWLEDRVRQKLAELHGNRINSEGEFVITSTRTRTQKQNFEDALEKLQQFIAEASYVPKETSEDQKRHVDQLMRKQNERRLQDKKRHTDKKSSRRGDW